MGFRQYVEEVQDTLDRLPLDDMESVVAVLLSAWKENKQIFVMGNGGSAATASHMACDLSKNTAMAGMPRLRVLSLNENMAHFSAHANDDGYENVFAEQLSNFVNEGDVVLAISTSGNSANVLKAVEAGRAAGATTVGWCGSPGGRLARIVDVAVVVPSTNIEQVEDIHLMMEHMVTVAMREAIVQEASRLADAA